MMDIDISYSDADAAVVALVGRLDIDTSPDVRAAFETLRDRAVIRIVVDLSRLDFCDSIGLSTFVIAHRRCIEAGGWVRIAAPVPFMVRLLSVVGIAEAVPMYQTVEGARNDDASQRIPPVHDPLAA
jgi:anti-anti-sigma factor